MSGNLAEKIQLWGFEDDFVVFKDGSIGFGLDVNYIDVSTWTADQINELAYSLDQFLNSLPPHLDLQFIQEIKPGNESIFSEHEKLANSCINEEVKVLLGSRLRRWRNHDLNGFVPFHGLKLFVRRPSKHLLENGPSLLKKPELFPALAENEFEAEVNQTRQLRESITRNLIQMGFRANVLSQAQILEQIYTQWNPERSKQLPMGYYDPEFIVPNLIFSDVQTTEKGFCMGSNFYRVVSLKSFPDVTFAAMAQVLRELPFNSKLFLSIHVPDQQKEFESLQSDRRIAYSLARGKRNGVADLESEAKLQEIESLLADLISQGEKVFNFSLQVLLTSESETDLDSQVAKTLSKVRQLAGGEAMQETLAAFDIFNEIAVPNAKANERKKKIKTTNLSDFLPVYGPWRGHSSPSVLLRSRLGSVVSFDPFSTELTNHNVLISGGSGSGKSFCANLVLLQLLKESPRIYIVDIGNSYGRLCKLMGGESVQLGLDMNLSINPFDLSESETAPTGEKVKYLVNLIELMTKENETSGLSKLDKALLEECILKCYEQNANPILSDLKTLLGEHSESNIRRLSRILNSWTGNSSYGKFIDRKTNIELKSDLISFDLKGLDSVPDLQAVSLFLITDLVWREVQKDRGRKKMLLFDECWQILENEAGSHFIGNVFRTFRKYYAGVIAISQDIDDFARSKVANAILPNSGTKIVLMQKGANQKRLAEVLQLNETEAQLVSTLYQDRGKFSEAFLISGGNRSVIAFEPTPAEYWISTTDPRDVAHFEKLQSESPDNSLSKIVESLSVEMPFGVLNSISKKEK
ncbi:MAG: ATP-binding protein [Bdellovibrionaceae bacterium]|nr:ATP-binding protein [Pseudobdellovibrionaceae bacterium]